ncbi:MAG: hypothetical protein A3E87_02400 [Gammaproteobacteria bacterium RIFCSPHIGHO2_12_FULL_35_23]|nr:MAG: hypothetical protein A3E87_02400 [Gammaproteobacteria bacterium RIFCSPHIGHO2_12_FULL_35_23]
MKKLIPIILTTGVLGMNSLMALNIPITAEQTAALSLGIAIQCWNQFASNNAYPTSFPLVSAADSGSLTLNGGQTIEQVYNQIVYLGTGGASYNNNGKNSQNYGPFTITYIPTSINNGNCVLTAGKDQITAKGTSNGTSLIFK